MRILEEFWYGNINPNEQSFDKQSRFGKVMKLLKVVAERVDAAVQSFFAALEQLLRGKGNKNSDA